MEILKHRYVTNEITADQYLDTKGIIEADNLEYPSLLALKEQYARSQHKYGQERLHRCSNRCIHAA